MSESKLKLWRNEEMACVRAEKAGAWVKMRRMAESAATLMRQMTYFIELLMLTGQHTCSNKARQMLMHISRQLQDRVSEAVDLVTSKTSAFENHAPINQFLMKVALTKTGIFSRHHLLVYDAAPEHPRHHEKFEPQSMIEQFRKDCLKVV